MAQLSVKVQSFTDGYRIVVGDAVSLVADYGDPVELVVDGTRYVAYCDSDDKGDVTTVLDEWVYKATAVKVDIEELDEEAPDGDVTKVDDGQADGEDQDDAELEDTEDLDEDTDDQD